MKADLVVISSSEEQGSVSTCSGPLEPKISNKIIKIVKIVVVFGEKMIVVSSANFSEVCQRAEWGWRILDWLAQGEGKQKACLEMGGPIVTVHNVKTVEQVPPCTKLSIFAQWFLNAHSFFFFEVRQVLESRY